MCNPSKSPTKASASSQPQSSAAAIPPSPASTSATSRMTSSSSSSSSSTPSPASRDTNQRPRTHSNATANATAPILKLVATLRNSEEGLVRSPNRQAARHRIIRRPGQESRDDSRDDGGNYLEPPPGSFRPIHDQHEEDDDDEEDDDEIPALIDEDQDRYTSPIEEALQQQQQDDDNDDNDGGFLSYGHTSQRRTLSLPVTKRKIPIESSNHSNDKQEQDCMGEGAMPFFVLDWMIDDLVPEQQNAQDLANILRQQESQQTFRNSNFSPLRKSKSCGIVGSATKTKTKSKTKQKKASPIIQRILPWAGKTSASKETGANQGQTYRPATPIKDPGEQLMPLTPKSSNRKSSKSRQKERKASLIDSNDDDMDMPFAPRNLSDSLNDCQTTAVETGVDLNALQFPKFMPRVDSSPPPQHAFAKSNEQDSWMVKDTKSPTKKSASCPQLYQETDNDNDDDDLDEHHVLQQRQRAKEQHDRRERRNKLTVVQRSLTQAQGWNNKGLSMAGNATRAEQYTHDLTAAQGQLVLQHPEQWWESSLECWDNALEIYRSLLGEYHERVADVQNNRGIALGKLGRFEEALVVLGMALEARKRQERRSSKGKNGSAAIVSTMHNIANVFRDAGNPGEALRVLVEAQTTLRAQLIETSSKKDENCVYHLHHCWHQSARLSTAIGHVYYESESFKDAREAYGEALEAYDKLRRSLGKHSDELGWGDHQQDPNESNRLELLHHQQLIQREVSVLQKDLDELDRSQQAKDGSRARLLQARRQQQQQQQQQQNYRRSSNRAQQQRQQQQQHQKQQQTLFGIMSSLRA